MSRRPPPFWSPPQGRASEYDRDTLRNELPGAEPDLGERDTIAVPLGSADTLPCPRLDVDELPTLRASPAELAALVAQTRLPPAPPLIPEPTPLSMPRPIAPQPARAKAVHPAPPAHRVNRAHPLDRTMAVRLPDPGPDMPTEIRRQAPGPNVPTQARLPAPGPNRPAQIRLPEPGPNVPTQVRLPEPGPDVPTQLWFAPAAPRTVAPRLAPRGLWARLWSLLGLAAPRRLRAPAHHLDSHRQRSRRRE